MLTPRELERVRNHLDTFIATVRPSPTHRSQFDVSYVLSEFAVVLNLHRAAGETSVLTPHACFKALHSEEPEGWLLYVVDDQGHWVPNESLVFTADLSEALIFAKTLLPTEVSVDALRPAS
ncbi:MAG: hypothetical protein U0998_05960 [Moraxellaceae bacterium]|nr:hypothetical protein [Moraxellaceae bacterium]MDZ4386752.1 hypothetical protein [Moraxellaceae bacterium]